MNALLERFWVVAAVVGGVGVAACGDSRAAHELAAAAAPEVDVSGLDYELADCHKRVAAIMAEPAAPGAPLFDERRIAILGRAFGEPLLFVRAPAKAAHDWTDGYADGLELPVDFR